MRIIKETKKVYKFKELSQEAKDKAVDDFDENIYVPLCLRAEKRGYEEIEYESSEEYFKEECEANEWEFLENGDMY